MDPIDTFSQLDPPISTNGRNNTTCIPNPASNCTDPRRLIVVLENSTGTCFVCITKVLGQGAGLSKVCLYADADWLTPICRSESGVRSVM